MEVKEEIIRSLAEQYNNEEYFRGDPIIFPKHFAKKFCFLGASGRFLDVDSI